MSLKGLGRHIRAKEQARKLPLARILAAGPPAGSGITLAAWRSWHEYEFFACPRRGTTCADPKCKIGSACLAMREIGLDGNGGPLRRRDRPKCGARLVRANLALFVSSRERLAVDFMAGCRRDRGRLEVGRELLRLSGDDGRNSAPPTRSRGYLGEEASSLGASAAIRPAPHVGQCAKTFNSRRYLQKSNSAGRSQPFRLGLGNMYARACAYGAGCGPRVFRQPPLSGNNHERAALKAGTEPPVA
jgi:hypothetical protein